jgi:hypothetical protein
VSEQQRRQRPVLIGELSPLPAETWVPELLRNYGTHTMSRAELEAARRAFVYEALDRKFAREEEDRRNARYVSAEELLTPVIDMLTALPHRLDYSKPELQRLMDARASDILSAAGTSLEHDATGKCRLMERPREAIDALNTLRTAALKLGPLAEQTLDLAGELLKLDTYVEGGPSLIPNRYLLIDKIDAAIDALRPHVNRRREPGGNRPRGARIADQVARAYAEITGELPPTTKPNPDSDPAREPPYHRLVRRIFEHYRQRNWKECAWEATDRLHKIGRKRHLRTARRGRPPRSASREKLGVE